MIRFLLLIGTVALVGCASSKEPITKSYDLDDYCYTNERIEVNNDQKVNSNTVIECTDNPFDRVVVKRAGIAENCGISVFQQNLGGKVEFRKAITCQYPDGSWDIIGNIK